MKKLSKGHKSTLESLIGELDKQASIVDDLTVQLNTAISEYNDKLAEAREWRDEIVADMETFWENRSEKWQESEAGSNYSNWMSQYQELDLDELQEADEPALSHHQELANLNEGPDDD